MTSTELPQDPRYSYLFDYGITTSIERALLNCMDAREILNYLVRNFAGNPPLRDKLLKRLSAIVENDENQLDHVRQYLAAFLNMDEAEIAPTNRPGLDAAVGRLALMLPPNEQMALAPTFLMHKRAARRRTGAIMVGAHPELSPPGMKQLLLETFELRHDPEVLTPLSRIQVDVGDIAPWLLSALSKLHDPQCVNRRLREQARVFERLLATDLTSAVELAEQYPTAFVYGVGRAQHLAALDHVIRILEKTQQTYEHDLQIQHTLRTSGTEPNLAEFQRLLAFRDSGAETLRLGIWTLGKLQARAILVAWARDYNIPWFEDANQEGKEQE
ncbi:MAG: hypothetical protein ACXWQZ_17975 [Ktedonobacterales bacterium]